MSSPARKTLFQMPRLLKNPYLYALALVVWVVASFYAAQILMLALVWGFAQLGIELAPAFLGETVITTIMTAIIYLLSLVIVAAVPYWTLKNRTTRDEMGLRQSLPLWRDLGLAPLVYITCFVCTAVAIVLLQVYIPGFNPAQQQEIPFDPDQYMQQYELLLIFLTLAIIAPVAEELLFRGYLFGKLRKKLPALAVILITAIVFSALHLGIGSLQDLQWNVAVDTFILALGLGLLRHFTGSVWASILVHVLKNSVAFFVLFILPRLVPAMDMMQYLQ